MIPSYYFFNKTRPKAEEFNISPSNNMHENMKTYTLNVFEFEYKKRNTVADDIEVRDERIPSTKIVGRYANYLALIFHKQND